MKIVLDTNVLVSGILSPFGRCGDVLRLIFNGELTLCVDSRILCEYADVLHRPRFQFELTDIDEVLETLKHIANHTSSIPLSHTLPDLDDKIFVEVALASNAKVIITGNLKQFPSKACCEATCLSPSQFIELYYHEEYGCQRGGREYSIDGEGVQEGKEVPRRLCLVGSESFE